MLRSTEKKQKLTNGLQKLGLDPKTHLQTAVELHLKAGQKFFKYPNFCKPQTLVSISDQT